MRQRAARPISLNAINFPFLSVPPSLSICPSISLSLSLSLHLFLSLSLCLSSCMYQTLHQNHAYRSADFHVLVQCTRYTVLFPYLSVYPYLCVIKMGLLIIYFAAISSTEVWCCLIPFSL